LAEKKGNNEGVEEEHNEQPNKQNNGKELLLPPMDYPDTVEAVFKYGSGGHFASWGPFAKYVYTIYTLYIYPSIPITPIHKIIR
jgi:hypothetical protein